MPTFRRCLFVLAALLAWGGADVALGGAGKRAAYDRCRAISKGGAHKMGSYNASLERTCERFGCDPALVAALITVESSWNPYAVRYEPGYQWLYQPEKHAKRHGVTYDTEVALQRVSWGLLQVLGATARELGFNLPLPALCEPQLGIEYGIRYLVGLKRNYMQRDDLIAAYNAGSARKNAEGQYVNQRYVDKVKRVLKNHDGSR